MSELARLRVRFARALGRLLSWAENQGHELALDEGYVALTDAADGDHDGPHKRGGAHYTGLAVDLVLYVQGVYIRDGSHPTWHAIGEKWESLDPLARWGGRFGDANHLSLEYKGRK